MPVMGLREGKGEMPRERIQCSEVPEFDVTVTWNRNATVQVATTANNADERLRRWTEESPPGAVADKPMMEPGTSFRLFDGWHVNLDRKQVNDLIVVLRRARDQAFGRDE